MRFFKKALPLVTGLVALAGCTKADLLNVIIPRSGYNVYKDLAYGAHPRLKLDVYVPEKADRQPSVVVFFYGGSWQKGYKELYKFAGQAFASRGHIAVVADYRLYPEVYFPDFMEDAACAVAWVHAHISEYGGNPDRIFTAGHSAGGYIAVMLALNDSYLKQAGGNAGWIKGAAGISGPYDFLPFTDPNIRAIFSKAPDVQTQPISFARRNAPPLLLLTSDADAEVWPKNAVNLTRAMKAEGARAEVINYADVGHTGMVLALAHGFRSRAPVLDDIDRFIRNAGAGR
jgi:acetyl esterase/lipase